MTVYLKILTNDVKISVYNCNFFFRNFFSQKLSKGYSAVFDICLLILVLNIHHFSAVQYHVRSQKRCFRFLLKIQNNYLEKFKADIRLILWNNNSKWFSDNPSNDILVCQANLIRHLYNLISNLPIQYQNKYCIFVYLNIINWFHV